jgi:hypothetical protein
MTLSRREFVAATAAGVAGTVLIAGGEYYANHPDLVRALPVYFERAKEVPRPLSVGHGARW